MIVDSEIALRIAIDADNETEHLEFKAASNQFEFSRLVDYCAALANEGGGHIILGITDRKPRQIVGTRAFPDLNATKKKLFDSLRRRIEVHEILTAAGRVLSFRSPPIPKGHPIAVDGRFLMRLGESLVGMSGDKLREILQQDTNDLSATLIPGTISDLLDPELLGRFRKLAAVKYRRQGNEQSIQTADWFVASADHELLENISLASDGKVTLASLLLLGSERGLVRHFPQAEFIFEYRSSDAAIEYQERRTYRIGFLGFMDDLWASIAKRNEIQSFQSGLLRHQIPTFSETSVREGLLNAICHRSYFDQASVLIRQFPRKLEILSPGGFPQGVTADNILSISRPRNRLLHEAMERCGLVERSGQGADLMFREAIRSGKHVPSFSGSDDHMVALTLNGQIRDGALLGVLEKIQERMRADIELPDLRVIDAIFHNEPIPVGTEGRSSKLVEQGILEKANRGKLVLARSLYAALGQKGVYTRRKGLAHEAEKALLLQHIKENTADGSPMRDLNQAMPHLDRFIINSLLDELRDEGKIYAKGQRRHARWHAGFFEDNELPLESRDSKRDNKTLI